MTYLSKDGTTLIVDPREDASYSDEFALLHDFLPPVNIPDVTPILTNKEYIDGRENHSN